MEVYSTLGDDGFMPMRNIIYFNQNNDLRLYVPYCGNLVFVGANIQMCNVGSSIGAEREIKKLFKEAQLKEGPTMITFTEGIFLCYEQDMTFYKLYGNKYGISGLDELELNMIKIKERCFLL